MFGGCVLRCLLLPPSQVNQLGLGAQLQEVLPRHVAVIVRQLLHNILVQINLTQKWRLISNSEFEQIEQDPTMNNNISVAK